MSDDKRSPEPAELADTQSASRPFMVIVLGTLIAGMLAVLLQGANRYYAHTLPTPKAAAAPTAASPAKTHGSPDAPLKIEAALGDCIMWVGEGLAAAVEPWPDQVSMRLIAYGSEEGRRFVAAQGETLACICFNGKHEFSLKTADGKDRKVRLVGPPGGNYTLIDLSAILKQQWNKQCGQEPEGFAEALEGLKRCGAPKEH